MRCYKEYCLYVKKVGDMDDDIVVVVGYIDDLTIMSNTMSSINIIKDELNKRFIMKDLGEIGYILKMEVVRDRKAKLMRISQK